MTRESTAGPQQAYLCLLGAFLIIVGIIWRIRVLYLEEQKKSQTESPTGLLGTTQVLCRLLRCKKGLAPADNDNRLRITIHRVTLEPNAHGGEAQQVLPYVGGEGGPSGRTFSIKSGIIGQVTRTKKPYSDSRQTEAYSDYAKELVEKWSYTYDEARKITSDRKSWMAVPIVSKPSTAESGIVIGVLYLDSNDADFFTTDIQEFVVAGSEGIKEYIEEVFA
ncbi:MAG: hypothetical protein EOO88_60220 [Pedobacter sp.]|nr:MAG: hypothetical protein EOO88_60220 [Pedobacter sp.]